MGKPNSPSANNPPVPPSPTADTKPPLRTVLEVLQSSAQYLEKYKVESARLNAEHLLAHALGMKKRIDLYMAFDRPLAAKELEPMRDLIRRRGQGVPLQHLLGTVEFHGREFAVDRRALIPRPETEQFVEILLKLELPPQACCLDVGTGTGVIALTLAAQKPEFRVCAVDCSPDALALARENAARLTLADPKRVEFVHGDLLCDATAVNGPYDLIAANLPYIARDAMADLSREVGHDPVLALDGGPLGLDLIARCIAEAPDQLATGGRLALEIGHDQAEAVKTLLAEAGFEEIEIRQDYQSVGRFALAQRGE